MLTFNGYNFTPERDEIYFDVELTVPRLTEKAKFNFVANRYRYSDGTLSDWRIMRSSYPPVPHGVGPKTLDKVREEAQSLILEWILKDETFGPARRRAIADYIVRLLKEQKYGFLSDAREALRKYASVITPQDFAYIKGAMEAFESGWALLQKVGAP